MPKDVFLFNTLGRKKEKFVPLSPGEAKLYACGPTVYHYAHIGNLRTYVFEDILVRALKRAGYKVTHVMNITDVGHLVSDGDDGEDKMEVGARRAGKDIWELAEYYAKVFFGDLEKLNVLQPQIIPKATDHIPEMISLVERLEKKGFVYRTPDGLYFDTAKFPSYPDFAKLDTENMEAGKRVTMGAKHSPTDFALWKFSPAGTKRQMEWESPWGKGFPGWHIECSAMAMKYLGEHFDLHCGGIDHIPVHHTNEIAQSEAATGKPFVNYWMHGEFLNEDSGKMSKSKGETLTISVLERDGFTALEYRFLLLQAHYRSGIRFSYDALKAAQAGYRGIIERLKEWKSEDAASAPEIPAMEKYREDFDRPVYDDLNMPEALAVLFGMLKDSSLTPAQRKKLALEFDSVLGLRLEAMAAKEEESLPANVAALVAARDEARKNKNFADSDRFRNELQALGYKVEDTPKGTRVKL
ncbi:MAG: cysteine--tRNA ligase [Proteobacteria bacterium]|nr:MAG: cysteine--tRNA ligase [Pseudomonadota bacterium]